MKLQDLFEQPRVIEGDVIATTLVGYKHDGIPIAGATVTGFFSVSGTKIKSLEGSPSRVGGYFNCSNTAITSLEGISKYIGGYLYCNDTLLKTLHNIHKQIKHIGNDIYLPQTIKSHILGVMYIKGLKGISVADSQRTPNLRKAVNIINKHLPDGNIHDVQEELIEAGLKEFARL